MPADEATFKNVTRYGSVYTVPTCCPGAQRLVFWSEADKHYGPERAGWIIVRPPPQALDLFLPSDMKHAEGILFCPFCGKKLPEEL
jgi:hypothetical protein